MGYTTKKSLLEAICSGDEVSWHEFYEIYRPLIVVRGRDYKLNVAEIDELEAQAEPCDIFNNPNWYHGVCSGTGIH